MSYRRNGRVERATTPFFGTSTVASRAMFEVMGSSSGSAGPPRPSRFHTAAK